jgi:ligand-binding sensor domain-containing protein
VVYVKQGATFSSVKRYDGNTWYRYDSLNVYEITAFTAGEDDDIWLGSEYGGLRKHDGNGWTIYNTGNSQLPTNYVTALDMDMQGNIWVGTYSGLAKFDGQNWTTYNKLNSIIEEDWIFDVYADYTGRIFFRTALSHLYVIENEQLREFDEFDPEMVCKMARPVLMDEYHNLWFKGVCADKNILTKYDGQSWRQFNIRMDYEDVAVCGNDVWVGTKEGLVRFDGINWPVIDSANSRVVSDWMTPRICDSQGYVWCGSRWGIIKTNLTEWITYDLLDTFHGAIESCYFEEGPSGEIWINITVNYLDGIDERLIKIENDIITETFDTTNSPVTRMGHSAMTVDDDGAVWLINANAGFLKYDGTQWSEHKPPDGINTAYTGCMAVDVQGNIWAGTGKQYGYRARIIKYDGSNWEEYDIMDSSVQAATIHLIKPDGAGNIWFGTFPLGLVKYDGNTFETMHDSLLGFAIDKDYNNIVHDIVVDHNDNLWIATWKGLFYLAGDSLFRYDTTNSGLSTSDITTVTLDNDGNLWAGLEKKGLTLLYLDGRSLGIIWPSIPGGGQYDVHTDLFSYPNPFTYLKTIIYRSAVNEEVKAKIYNIQGKRVRRLINGHARNGVYNWLWDGMNDNGMPVAPGQYIVSIKQGEREVSRKVVLTR